MEIQGAIRIDMTGDEIAAALTKSAGLPTPTELEQTIENIHDELDAKADAGAVSVAVEQLHADVATAQGTADDAKAAASSAQAAAEEAQGTADDAQAAATSAQGTADDAQAAAEEAKSEADMLRERLIGNGTQCAEYYSSAAPKQIPCAFPAGTYKFDGGDYQTVGDYLFLMARDANGNRVGDAFSSADFVGGKNEKAFTFEQDIAYIFMQIIDNDQYSFIAPGTITLKVIDMASLEGKLYDTASTMKTTATVAADLDK